MCAYMTSPGPDCVLQNRMRSMLKSGFISTHRTRNAVAVALGASPSLARKSSWAICVAWPACQSMNDMMVHQMVCSLART